MLNLGEINDVTDNIREFEAVYLKMKRINIQSLTTPYFSQSNTIRSMLAFSTTCVMHNRQPLLGRLYSQI